MAYIGKEPQVGNYIKLDAISTSSTNTYNLTKDSVAFTPESALHMLVSLNGVIQSPLSSFSVSGSTITFLPSSGTLSSSDTIDFILVLGNVLDIGTPSDSTVTNAKTNFVSTSSSAGLTIKGDGTSSGTTGTLQLNCSANSHGIKLASPAHSAGQSYTLTFPTTAPSANTVLQTDGSGNLSFANNITTENSGGISVSGSAEADFLNLPSGIKRIQINCYTVSSVATSSTDTSILVRLGTSSGLTDSGYVSTSEYRSGMGATDTSGFVAYGTNGSSTLGGVMTINHIGSNRFVASHSMYYNTSNGVFGGGIVTLGGTLDRVRVMLNSGGNFDNGFINIFYET